MSHNQTDPLKAQWMSKPIQQGIIDMLPLCIAVLPWGLLAGSMAIETGLDFWQSIGMSALLFAGAAQLVTLGMLSSNASMIAIIITIFFLTAQHLLYGLSFRDRVQTYAVKDRLSIGFLLTDELFAIGSNEKNSLKNNKVYLISAGLTLYICWNIFSLIGIYIAKNVPNLENYHLDFSIVATFIAIIVPLLKNKIYLIGTIIAVFLSVFLTAINLSGAIVISGLIGMVVCGILEGIKA